MASSAVAAKLSGVQKSAILLIALGDQASSALLKHLSPEQVQAVSSAIANLPSISAAAAESILEEFHMATSDAVRVGQGGIAYAKRILTGAFGPEGSKSIWISFRNLTRMGGAPGNCRTWNLRCWRAS